MRELVVVKIEASNQIQDACGGTVVQMIDVTAVCFGVNFTYTVPKGNAPMVGDVIELSWIVR